MNIPTITVRGKTYVMQPISDERWDAMRAGFEREFQATEAEYADRHAPLIPQPLPSQFSESWGT